MHMAKADDHHVPAEAFAENPSFRDPRIAKSGPQAVEMGKR